MSFRIWKIEGKLDLEIPFHQCVAYMETPDGFV